MLAPLLPLHRYLGRPGAAERPCGAGYSKPFGGHLCLLLSFLFRRYHGQGRLTDPVKLATEYDLVVTTYVSGGVALQWLLHPCEAGHQTRGSGNSTLRLIAVAHVSGRVASGGAGLSFIPADLHCGCCSPPPEHAPRSHVLVPSALAMQATLNSDFAKHGGNPKGKKGKVRSALVAAALWLRLSGPVLCCSCV